MAARDSNNATWYILRYATDFAPRVASPEDPAPPQFVPPGAPALVYDDSRHVLELMPGQPAQEVLPPPGLAIGLDGEVYRAEPDGRLMICRCDGSETPLLCEPGILLRPAGLALDRRGFLYVADPAAGRAIVLRPDDRSSVAILHDDLTEPVDIAVAPDGQIYVADRAGGRIVRYSANFQRLGAFVARGAGGLPAAPRPIAVMVDADGTVLVADGNYPWLLCFSPLGRPLGDVSLAALAGALTQQGLSLDALESLQAPPAGQPAAGACGPCFGVHDGGGVLARLHRDVRLLSLRLNHTFVTSGVVLSAALDGRVPGTVWHKLIVDADLPEGSWITVETATAESAAALAGPGMIWSSAQSGGVPIPFTTGLPDQLVQSPPGRYLRLRITLGSDGQETPSLRSLKLLYPRVSCLDLLPRIYQRDADSAGFLQQYLALFEHVLTGVEDRYDAFSRQLDPNAASPEVVDWMALLLDLSFDPSWQLPQRRSLIREAVALYRRRGTLAGLSRYIELYLGATPLIQESFTCRPSQPALLGTGRSYLGCGFCLTEPSPTQSPETLLGANYAHRFTVLVYLCHGCDARIQLPVVDRIIRLNKPAHTAHTLVAVYPDARIGLQSTIGVDYVVGLGTTSHPSLGEQPDQSHPGAPGISALGVNTVLSDGSPRYTRPITQVL
jgi:phage tail-like protein